MTDPAPARLLPWDSAWWGVRTARTTVEYLDESTLAGLDAWCQAEGVAFLYHYCPGDDTASAQIAATAGFRFVGIRERLTRDLASHESPPAAHVRPCRSGDLAPLASLAAVNHRNARFHADGRLSRDRCDELYRVWLEQDLGGDASLALAADVDGRPVGYLTGSVVDGVGMIRLVGVAAAAHSRGLGSELVERALTWFAEQGATSVSVVTQGASLDALRLYHRSGFAPAEVGLWFHKWYAPENQ